MVNENISIGDFVAQKNPKSDFFLKKGIVIGSKKDSFVVHWLSYNKEFFMEYEGPAFEELNSRYLLSKMSYSRSNDVNMIILSKARQNGLGNSW